MENNDQAQAAQRTRTAPADIIPGQIDDVEAATDKYIWAHYMGYIVAYCIAFIGALAALIYYHLDIQVIIFALVIPAIGYAHVKGKVKSEFMRQFGQSIGFSYAPTADLSTISGRIFSIGRNRRAYDVLFGTYRGMPTRIFSYDFTVGQGKSQRTYTGTVFETAFPSSMPDILARSAESMGYFGSLSALGFGGAGSAGPTERIKLEGDFNKYFSLEVPKGYELEAYQIFTPDVMASLIDKASKLDFEFNGPKLYIYVPRAITARSDMQAMFDLSEYLDGLLNHNISEISVPSAAAAASADSSSTASQVARSPEF